MPCRACGWACPEGRRVYCGDTCKRKWRDAHRHRRVDGNCAHCGVSYRAIADVDGRARGKYCSVRCAGNAHRANGTFKGANNPRWLGGVSADNMRYRRRQKERWPEREAARAAVAKAVRAGKLTRLPCSRCGEAESQAHHHDYSKPLEVEWLCRPCHDDEHRLERAQRAAQKAIDRKSLNGK